MFVETITSPRDEWDDWNEKLGMLANPPDGLVAAVAWSDGDGSVTQVNVWDAPGAISDFYIERVLPLVQAEGEPQNKPRRHGQPLAVYVRH